MPSIISATTTTGLVTNADNSGSLQLATNNGTTAVTIDTSQNVGIGTTTPTKKVDIFNSGTTSTDLIIRNGTVGLLSFVDSGAGYTGTSTNHPLLFTTNSAERMRIDSAGALILTGSTAQKATGTTWSNPSDIRLKNNIQEYTKGLPELMQVNVKTWEYNGKGGTVKGTKGLGVVADEIKEVLPDTVDNYKAKLNADDAEDTDIKKFDATEITWLMLKSIQELKAELDATKAEVQALKGAR
jgi:trimeric autotransporter adhesin